MVQDRRLADVEQRNVAQDSALTGVVSRLSTSIQNLASASGVQTAADNVRLQQLSTGVLDVLNQVNSLSSRTVKRCRVCFWETEGSSQCQGNRGPSCSGWSDGGDAWTPAFRDDTDNRSGGCNYQWKIDCQM